LKINIFYQTKKQGKLKENENAPFQNLIGFLKEDHTNEYFINIRGKGDLLHCNTCGLEFLWRGLKYKDRKILTINDIPDSITGTIPANKPFKQLERWYFKKVVSYADICLTMSPTIEKEIKDMGVTTSVVIINNPLNVNAWRRSVELRKKGREMLNIKEDEFCILGVGVLNEKEDSEDFIEIGKQIPEAQFRWIGSRSAGISANDFLKSYSYIHHAPSNIHFPGKLPISDMPCIYAAGDILIVPIFQKDYCMKPIEAAASGMPVVFRNNTEYKLLYNNEYIGVDNNDQFVIQLKKLIKDEEEYNKGLEISKKLIAKFDKNDILKKLINLYTDLYDFALEISKNKKHAS
jgi:1,2-diacylglycerol-3-alpha-glucose alpha-1,2-galactosyltransferase